MLVSIYVRGISEHTRNMSQELYELPMVPTTTLPSTISIIGPPIVQVRKVSLRELRAFAGREAVNPVSHQDLLMPKPFPQWLFPLPQPPTTQDIHSLSVSKFSQSICK